MAKVIMICGRICSGKTTYAESLRKKNDAIILSIDEIMLSLFGKDAGEHHDEYVAKTEHYLLQKSLSIIEVGVNVILDWGFWTKEKRDFVKNFYRDHGVDYEFHYLDIGDAEWHERLDKRNKEVEAGKSDAYYVDEGLAVKFDSVFEKPKRDEIDLWISI